MIGSRRRRGEWTSPPSMKYDQKKDTNYLLQFPYDSWNGGPKHFRQIKRESFLGRKEATRANTAQTMAYSVSCRLSRQRSESTFLWKTQFELIIHEILSKINIFTRLMAKSLRNQKIRGIFEFFGSYFLWHLWNLVIWTNMESNAAVTLHLKTLRWKTTCF